MRLDGSCTAARVRFRVESHTPYPYMRCYCSICRKTQGGGGYAINIMGDAPTLQGARREARRASTARASRSRATARKRSRRRAGTSAAAAAARCGSSDPRWPEWVYPFASAIDTPLPKPPEEVELMLNYARDVGRRALRAASTRTSASIRAKASPTGTRSAGLTVGRDARA